MRPLLFLMMLSMTAGCGGEANTTMEKSDLREVENSSPVPDLVSLGDTIEGLVLDIRYYGEENFVGASVDGYLASKALISRPAADALSRVQTEANKLGYGLKVFDAYRPQQAVDHFVRWASDLEDQSTKAMYYPNVDKSKIIPEGYIAEKSGHSRGSTVDLTLVRLSDGAELDMGAPFDYFDAISWPSSTEISESAQSNRQLLRGLMVAQGFIPYEAEWWHFTLANEPYPDTYFNVPVQ